MALVQALTTMRLESKESEDHTVKPVVLLDGEKVMGENRGIPHLANNERDVGTAVLAFTVAST
jgi:hypothetical protein